MASIDEIQSLLAPLRISIGSELEGRFLIELSGDNFHILKSEIDNFISLKANISSEPETSIFYPGYYEHMIEFQAPFPPIRRFNRDEDLFRLSSHDTMFSLEISPASTIFLLKVLQHAEPRVIRRRLFFPSNIRYREKPETPAHWSTAFRRLTTIKISASKDNDSRANKKKFYQLAESSLFHIAYGSGDGIILSRSWERTYSRMNRRREYNIQFPRRLYESELVSYYQLALSSESLMLSYIALYKIIEFFSLSASEKVLHKLMAEKIIQPEFSQTKPPQLRQLATLIRNHDQRMNETKKLSTVIEQYFEAAQGEIKAWVLEYERVNGAYYTLPNEIFDETHTLDLNPDQISSSLAKRIYHIRNVLVHNKESEFARFVPFSGQEAVLSKEIPLILFLAEQLILKTGKDL